MNKRGKKGLQGTTWLKVLQNVCSVPLMFFASILLQVKDC